MTSEFLMLIKIKKFGGPIKTENCLQQKYFSKLIDDNSINPAINSHSKAKQNRLKIKLLSEDLNAF